VTRFVREDILAMDAYVPGEQPQSGKFIKLNTNENPYPCSKRAREAVRQACEQGMGLYPDPTALAFRMRAAELLGVPPDWILCGNGSDDLLTIVTRAFVGGGDWVRYPTPSYVLYRTLAQIQGAHPEEIRFADDWSLGKDFATPRDRLKLVYLANPNSPSGTMIPKHQILQLATSLPCPLLIDEAYVDFADQHCLSLVAEDGRILVSRSLSKSYALAGLRFGYLVAQPHVIQQLLKVKDSYNCSALAITGATAAIDDQAWLAETRSKIVATRQQLISGMRALGFEPVPSQANFVWNPHPSVPVRPLYERLKQAHILVRYMLYPGWGDGLRITVGSDEQIEACLSVLKSIMS
jgi:histidinol-phosphate aminotransferase